MQNKNIDNHTLALFFKENTNKTNIVSEIFNFFAIDCIERQHIDYRELDSLISEFEGCESCNFSTLEAIINCIRKGYEKSQKLKNELIQKIVSYLDENFASDISIEEIAKELNISYYYICHIFKNKYDISPNTYRHQKRLEIAVKKLMSGDEKISDIATSCGFNNISYFTEAFTKAFGVSPSVFRTKYADICWHDFFNYTDIIVAINMANVHFVSPDLKVRTEGFETVSVHEPDDKFKFLHEAAIIEHHGILYTSWYSCPENELQGYTPICGKRSHDGGKTWTDIEVLCEDRSGKILYCPPVYGICDDKLYLFVNQMVAPDHMHSLDLYILNEKTGKFEFLWSRPIPFKLNTNVIHLPNGKLLLPGRIGALDGFPQTPTVMISDDGKIDTEWRLVTVAENGSLPHVKYFFHPEISVMCIADTLYLLCRDSYSQVPLVYISKDFGESWSEAHSHDIPVMRTKIYCGDLADGRHYIVANTDKVGRSKLSLYLTSDDSTVFTKQIVLFDSCDDDDAWQMHYPAACEYNGKLYIIATKGYRSGDRGAQLFIFDPNTI